jgi:hypothetical protein
MLKITGYILLTISTLSFIMFFIVPWFDLTKAQMAGISTVLVIIGEVLFYLSMLILGKTFYAKIKEKIFFWRSKPKDNNPVNEPDKKA